MKKYLMVGLGLCAGLSLAKAQSQYEVVVKSAFSPVIQDAQKKMDMPARIVDTVGSRQKVDYSLDVRPLRTDFTPEAIAPPRVGKDPVERLYQHSLKAGAGYLQPLLDYHFNTLRSTRQSFGLRVFSHASFDQVKDCAPSDYMENAFALHAQQFRSNFVLAEQAGYSFDRFHCYGYAADSLKKATDWSQQADDIARHYHRAYAAMQAYTPSLGKSTRLNRSYSGRYDFLYDNFHSYEHNFTAGVTLDKRVMLSSLDMFRLGGTFRMEYAHDYWDTTKAKFDTWVFHAQPKATLADEHWSLNLGVNVGFGIENGETSVGIFPAVTALFDIVPGILSFYGGAEGDIYSDSYLGISKENPFLAPALALGLDQVYHFYVGTKTNLSRDLSFGAKVALDRHSALAYFLPDTTPIALIDTTALRLYNTFGIAHAAATVSNAHIDASYRFRESLKVSLDFDYFSYNTADTVTLYYKPHYQLGFSTDYTFRQKIGVGLSLCWKGDMKAPRFAADGSMESYELPDWVDLSLNMEYIWSKRLRFFLDLNNILGRSNLMYAGYYTERFNCLLGAKYIFGGE